MDERMDERERRRNLFVVNGHACVSSMVHGYLGNRGYDVADWLLSNDIAYNKLISKVTKDLSKQPEQQSRGLHTKKTSR